MSREQLFSGVSLAVRSVPLPWPRMALDEGKNAQRVHHTHCSAEFGALPLVTAPRTSRKSNIYRNIGT